MNGVRKIAAWVPMSAELWEDWDRLNHPWKYPDRRVLPVFDLFPRWTRITERWWKARRRIIDARLALHGQLRDPEDLW